MQVPAECHLVKDSWATFRQHVKEVSSTIKWKRHELTEADKMELLKSKRRNGKMYTIEITIMDHPAGYSFEQVLEAHQQAQAKAQTQTKVNTIAKTPKQTEKTNTNINTNTNSNNSKDNNRYVIYSRIKILH